MRTEVTPIKLPGTPKPWMNRAVSAMLSMPGLRSLMGRTFMVLSVTGAKTGTRYSTPVQYVRDGDRLLVLSQRKRLWWRNIESRPDVVVMLKGRPSATTARLAEGDEALAAIATCLRTDRRMASFYGVALDESGQPPAESVRQLHAQFVVIVIDFPAD